MRGDEKNNEFLNGKKFLERIKFWQNQMVEIGARAAAERKINKKLRQEIEQRKQAERAVQDTLEYVESIINTCLLYTSPSPRDRQKSRMPSSA